MKKSTPSIEDHKKAAILYNKKAQGKKLSFAERNILDMYEKRMSKIK